MKLFLYLFIYKSLCFFKLLCLYYCFKVDGNWSPWGSFGSCSVTCGMGAKTRYRYCNDTMPSVSAEGNGAYCPSTNLTFISCVMPRCDSPRDSTSATLVL